ncbi:MAG: HrcA family transcriptional regulator, partial [Chloroflexi bacterium]|nr:HrcA family transcriptional regulator [Chloroflexota bacterium]
QLIVFEQVVAQPELTAMANKLSDTYSGATASQIKAKGAGLPAHEQQVTDCLVKLMEAEDKQGHDDSYLDGLHFTLNQPEFANSRWLTQALTELIEQRSLLRSIASSQPGGEGVQVIIGKENKVDALRDYSVVLSRYGLPDEAEGIICVIGPTRMPYARTMATVGFLSRVLGGLVARLYGAKLGLSDLPPVTPADD